MQTGHSVISLTPIYRLLRHAGSTQNTYTKH